MNPLRLMIADDHELVRQGLRAIIEKHRNWTVCGEAITGRQAVEMTGVLKPDVIILDFSMPELNGLEATRQIRKMDPSVEVLILTVHDSAELAREVFAAGAKGYVVKSDVSRILLTAIEKLGQHKPFLTPAVKAMAPTDAVISDAPPSSLFAPSTILTAREREVVQLVSEGKSSKQVAQALGISDKTVETHRTNLMRKLGLHSVSELVRYAIRNKLIEP